MVAQLRPLFIQLRVCQLTLRRTQPVERLLDLGVAPCPGDPGAGLLRFNSDVFEDVSVISISDALADKRNPDVSRYVATWDKSTTLDHRGTLIITKRGPGPEARSGRTAYRRPIPHKYLHQSARI